VADYFDLPMVDEQSCHGCGACCMNIGMPPFMSFDDHEFEMLPRALQRELRSQRDQWIGPAEAPFEGQPCPWLNLETRQCRHYEHRPFLCREFRPGSEVCLEERERMGIRSP
jgi:uncharacterized protein